MESVAARQWLAYSKLSSSVDSRVVDAGAHLAFEGCMLDEQGSGPGSSGYVPADREYSQSYSAMISRDSKVGLLSDPAPTLWTCQDIWTSARSKSQRKAPTLVSHHQMCPYSIVDSMYVPLNQCSQILLASYLVHVLFLFISFSRWAAAARSLPG